MDTPTTMLLACTAGAALLPPRGRGGALALCAAGALVPDLDLLFVGGGLGKILYHRGPSHSLVFVALATPLAAWVARRLGARASYRTLLAAAGLGFGTALVTDLATWWGTVLLWPFTWRRLGEGFVFIVDPWILALALLPWVFALARRVRRRRFPRRAFVAAFAATGVYVLFCALAREVALRTATERAEAEGGRVADVFPQPFSPLRWSLAIEREDEIELAFVDLARSRLPMEVRRFERVDGSATELVDATEIGRKLLWFYRLPIHELGEGEDGRTLVTYRDLAYEIWLPPRLRLERRPPFRYRFVLDGERVESHGFAP